MCDKCSSILEVAIPDICEKYFKLRDFGSLKNWPNTKIYELLQSPVNLPVQSEFPSSVL